MKQNCLLICFLITVASDLFGTELRDVIAHPEKFENQRITVVGVARVPGDFYLCADEKAAADRHPSTALIVRRNNSTQPEYRELDRQWVRVTGVMSSKEGGGYDSGVGVLLEHVDLLRDRPPPRIPDSTVLGVFKNSTAEPLSIQLVPNSEQGIGTIFFLKPGDADETDVSEGRVVASQLKGSKNVPLHKREIGKPVASGEITFRSLPSNYEYSDEPSDKRRLYFKIADHEIKRVDVSEGRSWKLP
jgi:hypothetical protein